MQSSAKTDILIGVDGGGTKCRFALLHGGKRTEITGGPANVSTDIKSTLKTLTEGFDALATAAGLSKTALKSASVYLGLAGVLGAKVAQSISSKMPFEHIVVDDDRSTTVVGALGKDDGAVYGIGTGSFLGYQKNRKIKLKGGWGFTLGDEASGADLGRKALRRALLGVDGILESSDLTEALLKDFGGSAAIVDFAASAKPREFAKYAPLVVKAAQSGDVNGVAIMTEGAAFIERGIHAIGWKPGQRLCPAGGLAPYYTEFFHFDFARYISQPNGTALDGALILAEQICDARLSNACCN